MRFRHLLCLGHVVCLKENVYTTKIIITIVGKKSLVIL